MPRQGAHSLRHMTAPMGGQATPVSNLWAVYPDSSELEQLTVDPGGIGFFAPPDPPPYLIFASAITVPLETDRVQQVLLPLECKEADGGPSCHNFQFSSDGQYLSFFHGEMVCGWHLYILDIRTMSNVLSVEGGTHWLQWLPDGRMLLQTGHCEGGQLSLFDPRTEERRVLGNSLTSSDLLWTLNQTAFAVEVLPYQGLDNAVWAYNLVEDLTIINAGSWPNRDDNPIWTPDGYLIYAHRTLSYTDSFAVTFGPRQLWIVNNVGNDHHLLLGDPAYDYFPCEWEGHWVCRWQGDWLALRQVPFRFAQAPSESHGSDWNEELRCVIHGLDCPDVEQWALNWRTGEMVSWDQVTLPTPTPAPTPTPTLTPGPNLSADPIYVAPDGSFTLYPGPAGRGLWRVPAQGTPSVVIEDGHHFVYIP